MPRHLSFPLRLTANGALATVEQDAPEDVAESIAIILAWPLGTMPGNDGFGTENQLGQDSIDLQAIRESVRRNEPRADSVTPELLTDASLERGLASVRVGFDI